MVNFRVDDLDELLAELAIAEVRIDPHRKDYSYDRFAWIWNPESNCVELRQPVRARLSYFSPTLYGPGSCFPVLSSASASPLTDVLFE
jgi:hypothetical protein